VLGLTAAATAGPTGRDRQPAPGTTVVDGATPGSPGPPPKRAASSTAATISDDLGRLDAEQACPPAPSRSVPADPRGCRPPSRGAGDSDEACRWQMPAPKVGDPWRIWRNTRRSALWGRPGLVGLVLRVARGYARLYPGEAVVVGDLDAPGPRHELHRSGIDVDLYLPGAMAADNLPGGRVRENYLHLPDFAVRALRGRVESLAKLVTHCSDGRATILYNDDRVRRRLDAWLTRHQRPGWRGPGEVMRPHNRLHRFHFHVRVEPILPAPVGVQPEPFPGR